METGIQLKVDLTCLFLEIIIWSERMSVRFLGNWTAYHVGARQHNSWRATTIADSFLHRLLKFLLLFLLQSLKFSCLVP